MLLSNGPDPYDASAVRASMGSVFATRFVRTDCNELVRWKKRHGARLIGTSPAADTDYQQVQYNEPVILFMGWERQGLSADEQALCDSLVRIPMVGKCDSLNLAVATSLMLYEVFNQQRARAHS
jgi:TrmH family RNA methyltransferase